MAGEDEIIKLVNEGVKGLWEVVKDGQPSASAQTKYIQVMPSRAQVAWEDLGGWSTKVHDWSFWQNSKLDDLLGLDPSVEVKFHLEFQYGGKTKKAKGLYLNNFIVWCTSCHADWGFTVNVNASTTGNPSNLKSPEDPVGSIQLQVKLDYHTRLFAESMTWAFTAGADGSLRQS